MLGQTMVFRKPRATMSAEGELTMSEANEHDRNLRVRDMDRRTFLVAGTAMAASAALTADVANASKDTSDETLRALPATVASEPSPQAMDVIRLDCNCPGRLVQASSAGDGALTRFRPGDGVLVFGDLDVADTIVADQVVPLVFGKEADSRRRST